MYSASLLTYRHAHELHTVHASTDASAHMCIISHVCMYIEATIYIKYSQEQNWHDSHFLEWWWLIGHTSMYVVRGRKPGRTLCAAFIVWSNPGATDLCVSGVCQGENHATMKAFFILLSCKFTSNLHATYVLSCCLLIACPCACVLGISVAHNNITIVLVGAVPVVEGTTSPSLGLMEQALHIDTHMHTTHTQTQTQSLAHTHMNPREWPNLSDSLNCLCVWRGVT